MRLNFGFQPEPDVFLRVVVDFAAELPDDRSPTPAQKRLTATLLDGADRLGALDWLRLDADLTDIGMRVLAGGSYAWPRIRTDEKEPS